MTDGVFPEAKEFLAGYWIIDVDSPERAYQLAAEASAAPGPGGVPLNMAIARSHERPIQRLSLTTVALDTRAEYLLREVAPQVLGAVIRRYRDFAAPEDAVQEALLAAASQWPHEGIPDNPRGWLIQVASRRMTDYGSQSRASERPARQPEFRAWTNQSTVIGAAFLALLL